MDINLGQIKEYCVENNISLEMPTLESNSQFSNFSELERNTYFDYFLNHSTEISEWINKREEQKDIDIGLSM